MQSRRDAIPQGPVASVCRSRRREIDNLSTPSFPSGSKSRTLTSSRLKTTLHSTLPLLPCCGFDLHRGPLCVLSNTDDLSCLALAYQDSLELPQADNATQPRHWILYLGLAAQYPSSFPTDDLKVLQVLDLTLSCLSSQRPKVGRIDWDQLAGRLVKVTYLDSKIAFPPPSTSAFALCFGSTIRRFGHRSRHLRFDISSLPFRPLFVILSNEKRSTLRSRCC